MKKRKRKYSPPSLKYQNFHFLLKQKKFIEALKLLKSDNNFILDKQVSFDYDFNQVESNQIRRLLPKKEEFDNFLSFISALFFYLRERDLAYNLSKGLVIKLPDNWKANLIFGKLNLKLGIDKLAEDHISEAITINPKSVDAYFDYGFLLHKKGDFWGAISAYKTVLQKNPNSHAAHLHLGNAYKYLGEAEKTEDHYKKSIEINPNYLEGWVNYASFLINAKKDKKMFNEVLNKIKKKFPDSEFVDYLHYQKYMHKKRQKKASIYMNAFLDKIGKKYKQDIPLPFGLSIPLHLYKKKDLNGYEEIIDKDIEEYPDEPGFLNNKGWILFCEGKLDEAKDYILRALKIDPHFIEAKRNYISVLMAKNNLNEAEKVCYEILKISPNSGTAKLFLALIYLSESNINISSARSLLLDLMVLFHIVWVTNRNIIYPLLSILWSLDIEFA